MAKRKLPFPEGAMKPKTAPERTAGKDDSPLPIQPVSERFPALEEQEIIFTTLAPEAREVNVAGNFNDWRSEATPMKNTGEGKWVGRSMLRAGQYEYRFVVDGKWREDAQATQRVANPHGGFNSVLMVPLAIRTSIL
jgi:1,4-alpha-glucan branching enzyme